MKIETVVLSVSDKTGVVEFAKALVGFGARIISTGGTAKTLAENGIEVIPISKITGNAKDDYFDGRMKTISFNYESALLYRRDSETHVTQAKELGIPKIDMVVCNLYPFEKVTADPNITIEKAVDNIDIGGPCMVRAAAKNHEGVAIVVDAGQYANILDEMKASAGEVSLETRKKLAATAFARTADYDSAISAFFADRFLNSNEKRLKFTDGIQLGRYAENWHQKGWLYRSNDVAEPNVPNAKQVHGGAMGYNNYVDGEAALASVNEFDGVAVSIIKHSNPCGMATGDTLIEAFEKAWEGDPVSAFGSVIGLTRPLDMAVAKVLAERFVEVVVCPSVDADAMAFIKGLGKKKEGLRILETKDIAIGTPKPTAFRYILGGLLEQECDNLFYLTDSAAGLFEPARAIDCPNSGKSLQVGIVTKVKPPAARAGLYDFVLRHLKHVKSNAISIAREYAPGKYQILGMGCGQPNRKDSVGICGRRAVDNLNREYLASIGKGTDREAYLESLDAAGREAYLAAESKYATAALAADNVVLASDAFFPFRDGLDNATSTGVKFIVQPGGSVKDDAVIAAADEQGVGMIFTGVRKFNH